VISGRYSCKNEAHLRVNFVSFGSPVLGVLEPKSVMSISSGLGAPTILKKEQLGQLSAFSIKFLSMRCVKSRSEYGATCEGYKIKFLLIMMWGPQWYSG
jgi:hypothetical protein